MAGKSLRCVHTCPAARSTHDALLVFVAVVLNLDVSTLFFFVLEQACAYLTQNGVSLYHLHSGNVMIDGNGDVKMIDYGA
jgi:hypothetical protein